MEDPHRAHYPGPNHSFEQDRADWENAYPPGFDSGDVVARLRADARQFRAEADQLDYDGFTERTLAVLRDGDGGDRVADR